MKMQLPQQGISIFTELGFVCLTSSFKAQMLLCLQFYFKNIISLYCGHARKQPGVI